MPTITIDDAVHAKIKELAAKTGRSEEEVLAFVLESGLEYRLWEAEKIREARESLDRGEYYTLEEVKGQIRNKYQQLKEQKEQP